MQFVIDALRDELVDYPKPHNKYYYYNIIIIVVSLRRRWVPSRRHTAVRSPRLKITLAEKNNMYSV